MIILFNTDHNVCVDERGSAYFTSSMTEALSRFSTHISRLEVHLADENGPKESKNDQRCTIEARLENHHQPLTVTCHADTIEQAVKGATDKLKAALDRVVGKLKEH